MLSTQYFITHLPVLEQEIVPLIDKHTLYVKVTKDTRVACQRVKDPYLRSFIQGQGQIIGLRTH
mgnify:CR=1 FL=1